MNAPAQASRDCPVCGRNEAEAYLQKGELQLVRCRRCAMIYANPVPGEFASGAYYDQAGADYYLSPAKLESDYAAVRFERELRLFRKHCQGGAVLASMQGARGRSAADAGRRHAAIPHRPLDRVGQDPHFRRQVRAGLAGFCSRSKTPPLRCRMLLSHRASACLIEPAR